MDLGQMTVIPLPPSKAGSDIRQSPGHQVSKVYYANGKSTGAGTNSATTKKPADRNGVSTLTNGSVKVTNGNGAGSTSSSLSSLSSSSSSSHHHHQQQQVGVSHNGTGLAALTTKRLPKDNNTGAGSASTQQHTKTNGQATTTTMAEASPGAFSIGSGSSISGSSSSGSLHSSSSTSLNGSSNGVRTLANGSGAGGGGGYAPLINSSGHGSPVRTPVKSGSFYPINKTLGQQNSPSSHHSKMANGGSAPSEDAAAAHNGYHHPPEKFHVSEIVRTTDSETEEDESFKKDKEEEENPFFAGKKDILQTEAMQEKIISSKGTVRGVKNRVKAGIATFLEHQSGGPVKTNYNLVEKGQVVLYSTSMMIVRDTYEKCKMVRNILQTHMLAYEERDICMSRENQRQLAERLNYPIDHQPDVPQVFADGQHLGGAAEIEKMNENGELRKVFKKFKKVQVANSCSKCGGFLWVPCPDCHGSKKSLHRNHFTAEFCALRCIACDENGLVRCDVCESERKSK